MKLEDVLPALREGKNITRPKYSGWVRMVRDKIFLVWHNASDTFSTSEAMFDGEDILADDWRILG